MNPTRTDAGFSLAEYEAHCHRFWSMPAAWGDPQHQHSLASLWKDGGTGVISLLPLLGQEAAMQYRDKVRLPTRKAARIVGIAAETAGAASKVLEARGLATRFIGTRRAQSFSCWKVSPDFAPRDLDRRFSTESFRFSSALLYGGNWAAMSGATRLIYLGLGTMAHKFDGKEAQEFLQPRVPPDTWSDDLVRCLEHNSALRLACASYADLAHITGLHATTVKAAVGRLKHCPSWASAKVIGAAFEHQALAVYPAMEGQCLVYHFRDHLEPLPFGVGASAPVVRFCLPGVTP